MGDLLSRAMEGISGAMAPDPNNPFPVPPPSFMEYPLAFIGGLGQHPRAGPVTRGLSSLSGFAGQQMASRRADPLGRILPVAQEVVAALRDARFPGRTVPGETMPIGLPEPPSLEQTILGSNGGFKSLESQPFSIVPPGAPERNINIPEFQLPGRKAASIAEASPFLSPQQGRELAALEIYYPQTVKEERIFPEQKFFAPEQGLAAYRAGQTEILAQPQASPAERLKQLQLQANNLFGKAVVSELEATGKNDWPEAARSVIRKEPSFWGVLGEETKNRVLGTDKATETDKALQDYAQGAGYKDWESVPPKEKVKLREKMKTAPQMIVMGERERRLEGRTTKQTNLARFNRETGQIEYAPAGTTEGDIKTAKAQGKPFTKLLSQEIDSLNAIEAAEAQLDRMQRIAEEVGKAGLASLEAARLTGGNLGAAVGSIYDAAVLDAVLPFDRMQGGVRGAASPQLATMMKTRFPDFKDRPDVALTKVLLLRNAVQAYKGGIIKHLGGVPDNQIGKEVDEALKKVLGQSGGPSPIGPRSSTLR